MVQIVSRDNRYFRQRCIQKDLAMLTATIYAPAENDTHNLSQNETPVSDRDILERVREIRSGWTLEERVARRLEAERRFADLIEALAAA